MAATELVDVEVLHLEPSECLCIAKSLEEVALQRLYYQGCEICERYKGQDSSSEKLVHHIKSFHCNLAVSRDLSDGRKVFSLPCRRGCMLRGGANNKRSHYHCPFCSRMCGRRNNMLNHFKIKCTEMKWKAQQRELPSFSKRRSTNSDVEMSNNHSAVKFGEEDDPSQMQDHVITIMEMRLSEWIQDQRLFGRSVNVTKMLVQARTIYDKTKADLGLKKAKPFFAGKQWVKSFLSRFGMKDTMVVSVENPDLMKPPEKDVIMKIIEKVAERQVLYDPLVAALEDHSEENEEAIWNEIAEGVGLAEGSIAKQIWRNIEKKYSERTRPGANPIEPWEYEHYMKFLPTELVLEETGIANETIVETIVETCDGNDVSSENDRRMVTVSIQGDESRTCDEYYVDNDCGDNRVNVAKLRKVQLQMETMEQEHKVKMEMLQLQKTILMKKLNSLG